MTFLFLPDGAPDWWRLVPLSIMVACIGTLSTVYAAQHVFGLEPCVLCLYQRIPYVLAAVLALAAIMLPRGGLRQVLVAACIPVFVVSFGLAVYHVGVEQHWWGSVAGCGGTIPVPMSAADLQASLLQKPEKPCHEPDWTLFGLSMAVYNAALSAVLAAATIMGWRRMTGHESEASQ